MEEVEQQDGVKVTTKMVNKKQTSRIAQTIRQNFKIFILIGIIVILFMILLIGLIIFLTIGKDIVTVQSKCPDGIRTPKIDCLSNINPQSGQSLQSLCESKGCCWMSSSDSGGSNCVYPYNLGYKNEKYKEKFYSKYWIDLLKLNSQTEFSQRNLINLEARVEMQTDHRIHLKIYPRRNFKNRVQRWEIPSGIKNENVNRPIYRLELFENPFGIQIWRNNSNKIIFDTTKSTLVFKDQFLQITTTLSSPNIFGIGENSKETLLHDVNYKTWTLFASNTNPYEAPEHSYLYSQLPMYLNIEPDGQSHVVVFYNSNPSEIYLTPFPSLTYRAIGGIFDIYIFMGPTPVEALAQFQQAFGLPKLPPYWSLGLQIGSSNYGDLTNLRYFVKAFKTAMLPFDSVFIDTEYMINAGMFTLNNQFKGLASFVDELRNECRTAILKFFPGIMNHSLNYPYNEGGAAEKLWVMENFFSKPFVGKLIGRYVVYPDFTAERTREWWKDALYRFIAKDEMVKLDGIFLDYSTPYNENPSIICQNTKWNSPAYKPLGIRDNLYNSTLCMDSRHSNSKHYNIHGIYSHYMILATAKALEHISVNRSFIMSKNAFIGSGEYSSKYLGEYRADWYNFRRFVISTIEMSMFGFAMVGGDICGSFGEFDYDLCSSWIKVGGMSPLMRLNVGNNFASIQNFLKKDIFNVLNSTLYLRYSLLPFFYTQLYHATIEGITPIRPLAFEYPRDTNTYKVDRQWLWGDKLMVTAALTSGNVDSVYFPAGIWYQYYRGFKRISDGRYEDVQTTFNTTSLHIRGGSVIVTQECMMTAIESRASFVDIIVALDENFTANGDFYADDGYRKNSYKKENYHRLTNFIVYKRNIENEENGIIEIKRKSGKLATKLSYRDLIIYGLLSKPQKITVNENTDSIDSSKTTWDPIGQVYRVNLQTEVKRKVLVDNEYISLRWTGGFKPEAIPLQQ